MTNLHNTLYITTDNAYLARDGESLVVKAGGETKLQVPLHHLASVVCFGRVAVSPEAMNLCAEAGVALTFLSAYGRFLGRVEGRCPSTTTLRRAQYRLADDPAGTLRLAKGFVSGKIANSRLVLRRAARTRDEGAGAIAAAADRLAQLGLDALSAADLDTLRGHEGEAAARYFGVFDAMLASAELPFVKRSRRPPENEVNALLSFGYVLLGADCGAALESAGLDPAMGYLHAERSNRPALALDLMEEFRALVVDRLVMALVRLGQIKPSDFTRLPTGEVRMSDALRKLFLIEYQKRKREDVTHPALAEPTTWAVVPHIQARALARAIRGEGDYVPFLPR
ncbi:MAG: type I-C CRISPR-associated endonuclease Cas1c [Polyangiaceae bacterium]|nr:type I-C CRISPR-associated endonuclease Cas1c [Polyangiaceae bacterium]